jgi:microcystin-dependent protein
MEPYTGEIRIFAGNFAPVNWFLCKGQLLSISQYEALYTLIGTTYGGDGQTTFALPNLQSRVVVGQGPLPGGSTYQMGQAVGTENVLLTGGQLPTHTHPFAGTVSALSGGTSQTNPAGNYFGAGGGTTYNNGPGTKPTTLAAGIIAGQSSVVGGSQPHTNVQPVQAINYIICAEGIYPSQP